MFTINTMKYFEYEIVFRFTLYSNQNASSIEQKKGFNYSSV